MNNKNKLRINYLISFIILFAIELYIAIFVRDNFIRPYIGDLLVVILLYTATRIVFPTKFKHLPLYIFTFSVIVELLQLINIVGILGLSDNKFFSILIGTTFDIKDIICYGIGTLILIGYEKLTTTAFGISFKK